MGFFAGIAALCTPIALVVFWIFATRGRRNHPKWEILRRFRYAHRGLHDPAQGVPENSMAAFRRARAFQCGIELDVHLTKDLSLIHICAAGWLWCAVWLWVENSTCWTSPSPASIRNAQSG